MECVDVNPIFFSWQLILFFMVQQYFITIVAFNKRQKLKKFHWFAVGNTLKWQNEQTEASGNGKLSQKRHIRDTLSVEVEKAYV